jgi:hypothetical protein
MNKKLTLSLLTSAILITSSIASEDTKEPSLLDNPEQFAKETLHKKIDEWNKATSSFTIDAGVWYMMWDQNNDISNSKVTDHASYAKTDYDIDNTIATVVKLKGNYKLISGSLEYYSGSASTKTDEDVSSVAFGVFAVGLIPHVNVAFNMTKSTFERGEYTYDYKTPLDTYDGKALFKTNTTIVEMNIYPYNDYLGIGYRNYQYEVPAQFAVVNNGSVVNVGLMDTKLNGKFIQLALDNKKQTDKILNYKGIVYSATIGKGTFDMDSVSQPGLDSYLSELDATFVETSIGYTYNNKKSKDLSLGFNAGYRYNKITTDDVNLNQSVKLTTTFDTVFHGPYVNMVLSF